MARIAPVNCEMSLLEEAHNVIEQMWIQVESGPNETVLEDGELSLTRYEMFEQLFILSSYLSSLGAKKEKIVGIFLNSSAKVPIAAYAIMASGAAYLPLSPEYPDDRIRYMIENSECRFIVSDDILKHRLRKMAPSDIKIVTFANLNAFDGVKAIMGAVKYTLARIEPDSTAYVIYTSGTTGRPKGVKISHAAICNQMLFLKRTFSLGAQDRILQKTPLSFDAAQWELLALSLGCKVVMGEPGIYRDPEKILITVSRFDITLLQVVPTLLNAFLSSPHIGPMGKSLKIIFSGGEALTRSSARLLFDRLPGCRLVNLYGPTECTINSTYFEVDRSRIEKEGPVISIGVPATNYRLKVIDHSFNEVGTGEKGELIIGGIGVSGGYINHPGLNRDKFLNLSPDFYTRYYRSGDIVYQDEAGNYHFCGRTDSQVKVRGYRLELDEIKSLIDEHPWVLNSAVTIRALDGGENEILEAFIELDPNQAYLMDQGQGGNHHVSKANKTQVRSQLKNSAIRSVERAKLEYSLDPGDLIREGIEKEIFARKSYRFFEEGEISIEKVVRLLGEPIDRREEPYRPSLLHIQTVFCYLTLFESKERLLPKYGYASPGALYATQVYLEVGDSFEIEKGIYYLNPRTRKLLRVAESDNVGPCFRLHFVGSTATIEAVYKKNVLEVLEFEVGHILGLLDRVLAVRGWSVGRGGRMGDITRDLGLDSTHCYLASFDINFTSTHYHDNRDIELFFHPFKGFGGEFKDGGTYIYAEGAFHRVSNDTIEKRDVIAINQSCFERAGFGFSLTTLSQDQESYIRLGRFLHRLQDNPYGFGFLSSGYSSRSGMDLPTAKKINRICDRTFSASYFCLGGLVSEEQIISRGMNEDSVHMKGPTEIIRDDLKKRLPAFMVPGRVTVLDKIPTTANGKIDVKKLPEITAEAKSYKGPGSAIQLQLTGIWAQALSLESTKISVDSDFFALGGNSLQAVMLVVKIESLFGVSLSFGSFFETPNIEALGRKIEVLSGPSSLPGAGESKRIWKLNEVEEGIPVYFWPGLGGMCGGLRTIAAHIPHPVYGVELSGLISGEPLYENFEALVNKDLELIEARTRGPVIFAGYSFGARVAYEAAGRNHKLDLRGLFLLAPGNPRSRYDQLCYENEADYKNPLFIATLLSVFFRRVEGIDISEIIGLKKSKPELTDLVACTFAGFSKSLVEAIFDAVQVCFAMRRQDLPGIDPGIPVMVVDSSDDHLSFMDSLPEGALPVKKFAHESGHYDILENIPKEQLRDFFALIS